MTAEFLGLPAHGGTPRDVARTVNSILQGKINSFGTVTLTANQATTVVNSYLVGPGSVIVLFPQTADAAAEIGGGGCYIDPANYVAEASFTITHANDASTTRTFGWLLIGA